MHHLCTIWRAWAWRLACLVHTPTTVFSRLQYYADVRQTLMTSFVQKAVFFWDNGTTAIYDRLQVQWADSIDGPWGSAAKGARTYVTEGAGGGGTSGFSPEDPFVWKDNKGRFHMLINSNSGHHNCAAKVPCGGHLWSEDGLEWSKPHTPAFGTIVHQADGTTNVYDYCERPQIAQRPDGTPLAFYFGHGYSKVENVALMFCQDGDEDADCVTTVQ